MCLAAVVKSLKINQRCTIAEWGRIASVSGFGHRKSYQRKRERERKAVIEIEKHNEADRLKERGRDSLSNEPSLPCLSRCPPNPNICPTKPSLIMTPPTNPTPVFLCRHTHRHTDTHTHSHNAQVFAVTSRRNAGCWWESLPHCSCHIRSTARRPWAYACGVCVCEMWVNSGGGGGLGLGLCLRASPALQKTPLNSG